MEERHMHGPNVKSGPDNAIAYKQKLGLILFLVYLAVYTLFIAINVIKPVLMGTPILFGVNLAVWYGMFLIVLALVLGMFYNYFCTREEKRLNSGEGDK
jgi:uncharacterized membrane protein (DUF485 family)